MGDGWFLKQCSSNKGDGVSVGIKLQNVTVMIKANGTHSSSRVFKAMCLGTPFKTIWGQTLIEKFYASG